MMTMMESAARHLAAGVMEGADDFEAVGAEALGA